MPTKITMAPGGELQVPDDPIVPYIEGDGIGVDIWPAAQHVLDAAAAKHGKQIAWKEVLAGEKAFKETGEWLPEETVEAFRDHLIGIKGPLTTPVGGGFRSLNVALRQLLDLYVCLRPVRWFTGVPSPVVHPEKVDMVIFRENTEDVYAGLEVQEGTEEARKLISFLEEQFGWTIRPDSGIGIKPISETGSKRLIRAAIEYAVRRGRKSVTLMHKGNIQKFTEGAFRNWGYELTRDEFSDVAVGWDDCGGKPGDKILVKDAIADITFQQVLTRPDEFDVIAATNLNGDYLSDALAAQVGGIGIAPGGNINYVTGHGVFEATHGTAPKYAGQDKVNPGSLLLSGVLMFEHFGWQEAADDIISGARADDLGEDRHLRLRPPDARGARGPLQRVRSGHRRKALGTSFRRALQRPRVSAIIPEVEQTARVPGGSRVRALLAALAVLALASGGLVGDAAASAGAPSVGSGTAPRVTRIVTLRPFDARGLRPGVVASGHAAGHCWTGSISDSEAFAWRCLKGNLIYDPCFSSPYQRHLGYVVCPLYTRGADEPSRVLELRLTSPLPPKGDSPRKGTQGIWWLIRLENGVECQTSDGAAAVVKGVPAVYVCDGGGIAGTPAQTGEPWTVRYVPKGAHAVVSSEDVVVASDG